MSGDSQSTHWSYSLSQPSKWMLRSRCTTRFTVATQMSRGSIRSTASSFMPTLKPWLGQSWNGHQGRANQLGPHPGGTALGVGAGLSLPAGVWGESSDQEPLCTVIPGASPSGKGTG